jgi:hypothetical protein
MKLYDSTGKSLDGKPPNVVSASYARSVHRQGKARVDVFGPSGAESVEVRHELVRAQIPHLVTLIVYSSKFQLVGDTREYFVYAPMDLQQSVKMAFGLWRRWEKPRRTSIVEDLREDYPKVDDAAVSEPIDDAFFDEMWKASKSRDHKCAGDPRDPFAFTCLDPSVKVYRYSDFQKGLAATV